MSQIFQKTIPKKLLFDFLQKFCNKNNEYYRGLGVIQMVQDISKNNVNKEDLYLPFHVLEVMSAIDTYDQNGKWIDIEQQF